MTENWKKYKLKDVALLKRGYDLPSRLRKKGSYDIISSSGVTDRHQEYKIKGPGVVTGRYGTIGKVFYTESNFWPLNTSLYVKDFKGNDPKFIYYLLQTINWNSYSTKSAVPGIDRNEVHQEQVKVPELTVQKSIASILSALDDKIELNLQMNKTLEEMASALYKHWFVDFGLFQEGKFVESELGMIPEGWEVKTLGEFAELTMGQSPKSEYYNEDKKGLPFHQGVKDYGLRFPTDITYSTAGNREAAEGDILFSVRAPVGRLNIAKNRIILGRGLASLRMKDHNGFLFYALKRKFTSEDIIGSGTIFNSVNKNELLGLKFIIPSEEVLLQFKEKVDPLDSTYKNNSFENQTLTSLRDTLLPKLISGEVRVKEAEKILTDAL